MDRTDRPPWIRPAATACLLALVAGCATMGNPAARPLVPTGFKTRTGPYLVCTNARLDPEAPVIRQLQALETQVGETLGLRVDVGDHPIEIYILDDRKAFEHFLTFYYPDLPHRRAFFLANGTQRVVYTSFGDRLEEDIRHEATHALLNVALGDIPLWLDEGLAEYFEGPADRKGVNREHLDRLPGDLAGGWAPDLARLETLKSVRQMTRRDYRESWAWVHFLLEDTRAHKAALLAYLGDLRATPDAPPLSRRLEESARAPLLAHLARLRDNPVASRDSTVRLQSATAPEPVAPVAPLPKRRSFVGRLLGLFGP